MITILARPRASVSTASEYPLNTGASVKTRVCRPLLALILAIATSTLAHFIVCDASALASNDITGALVNPKHCVCGNAGPAAGSRYAV